MKKIVTFFNLALDRFPILLGLVSGFAGIELITFGFSLMNVEDTFVFYLGLTVVMCTFFALGLLMYNVVNSNKNSNKNK